MSTNTSTSFQLNNPQAANLNGASVQGNPSGGLADVHGYHQNDRINHSSPNKGPLSSSFGMTATQNNAMSMVGSQTGSIQQGSVGGITGIGGFSGMSGSGTRPTMNQTTHGKSFPYSMHRKTNSNKLPHIGSSNGKDNTSQSIQQPSSSSNIYQN